MVTLGSSRNVYGHYQGKEDIDYMENAEYFNLCNVEPLVTRYE